MATMMARLPPLPGKPGKRNAAAVERTFKAMREVGKLDTKADDAVIAVVRTLADALDRVDPEAYPAQVATLARAQLAALRVLRGKDDDDNGASLSELVAAMSGPLGDA